MNKNILSRAHLRLPEPGQLTTGPRSRSSASRRLFLVLFGYPSSMRARRTRHQLVCAVEIAVATTRWEHHYSRAR